MRKQWRRLEKSTKGAMSPQPSSQSTSCGRTTGCGMILKQKNAFISEEGTKNFQKAKAMIVKMCLKNCCLIIYFSSQAKVSQ